MSQGIRRLVRGQGGCRRRRLKRGRDGRRRRRRLIPESDDEIMATSVAGGEIGSRDEETKESVAGFLVYTVRPAALIVRWAATTRS